MYKLSLFFLINYQVNKKNYIYLENVLKDATCPERGQVKVEVDEAKGRRYKGKIGKSELCSACIFLVFLFVPIRTKSEREREIKSSRALTV